MGIGILIGISIGAIVGWAIDDVLWGIMIGFLLGAAIGGRGLQGMNLMQYPPHIVRRLIFSGILFFAVLFGSFFLIHKYPVDKYAIPLAILPSIPGLFFVYSIGLSIASLDELQRRIQVEAIAIGFGISAIVTLGIGFLGLVEVPQPSLLYIPLIMVVSWGLGKLWTMWKYR
jgi:hypothetical protein